MTKNNTIPKQSLVKLFWVILILIVLNYLVTSMFGNDQAVHLDGSSATLSEINRSLIKGLVLFIPIIGFILGWLVALIPYKKIKYMKKYLAASMITMIGIYGLYFVLSIIGKIYKMIS